MIDFLTFLFSSWVFWIPFLIGFVFTALFFVVLFTYFAREERRIMTRGGCWIFRRQEGKTTRTWVKNIDP